MKSIKELGRALYAEANTRVGRLPDVGTTISDNAPQVADLGRTILEAAPAVNNALYLSLTYAAGADYLLNVIKSGREYTALRRGWTKKFWQDVAKEDEDAGIEKRDPSKYAVWAEDLSVDGGEVTTVTYRKWRDRRKAAALMDTVHVTVMEHQESLSAMLMDNEHAFAQHTLPASSDVFRGRTTLYDSTDLKHNGRMVDLEIRGTEKSQPGEDGSERDDIEVDTVIKYFYHPRRFWRPGHVSVEAYEVRMVPGERKVVKYRAISVEELEATQTQALARATVKGRETFPEEHGAWQVDNADTAEEL